MHATLAALVALTAGQWIQPRIFDQPNLLSGNARAEAPTYFEFAPESGAGLPVAEDLCSALAAEVPGWSTPVDGGAGNWCLKGNGTTATGSEVAFEAVGSPTLTTATVCPSGPDCATKDVIQLTANTGVAATAARASGTGPLTACWLGRAHSDAQQWLVSNMSADSVAGHGWRIESLSAANLRVVTSNGSALQVTTPTGIGYGSLAHVCITHPGGTGPTSIYRNGGSPTVTASSALNSVTAKPMVHGFNGIASTGSVGTGASDVLGAFYVDQELSAAQIAAIARRVLADTPKALISGSPSLALTYTRTGSMFCSKADNTGSVIPVNRPCIAQNGILVEAAATNLVYNSQALEAATWDLVSGASVAIPTRTANYAAAPDGTTTAERFEFPATPVPSGGGYWTVFADNSMSSSPTLTSVTNSIYIKGTSGSGTIDVCLSGVGGAWLCNTACAYTASAWARCTITYTGGTAVRGSPIIGHATQFTGIARPANDVLLWGTQAETGSVATSYIPTTSAAATRGASLASFAFSPTRFDQGCIGTSIISNVNTDATGLLSLEDGTTIKQGLIASSGLRMYVGGSSAVGPTAFTFSGSSQRFIGRWSASASTHEIDGTVVSGAAGTPATWTNLKVGNYSGAQVNPGRYSRVVYDPRPTRCGL